MLQEPGVTEGPRPWHKESPHGLIIHIEEDHLLVARRTTNTMQDASDLSPVLSIDLHQAGEQAGSALLAFCAQWCRQPVQPPKK